MKKNINKKILESKRIIKEEKKKIKIEKKNLRKKKHANLRNNSLFRLFFKEDKNNYSFKEMFIVIIFSLLLGFLSCFSIITVIFNGKNIFLLKDLNKVVDVYGTLIENYNGDIDKQELVENAVAGMVNSVGDVYTSYANTNNTDKFNELVTGTYEGIGCTIQQLEDQIKVIEVYKGSPAFKAGIKEEDIIKTVDDKDALEMGADSLANYIKKEAKEKIELIVIRDGKEKSITLKRDKVELPAVNSKVFENDEEKIGYLGISIFSSVSAKQFAQELELLEDKGITGLIIDVRGNNGGYLTTVTDIASMLLPKGKTLYQIKKDDKTEKTKDKTSEKRSYPIAILVNGQSASASEILAGAIKESYNGFVVGTKTFGKGTVQQVKTLDDGSMIKYTVENWLTPNGNWINEEGIEPTHEVELSEDYFKNPSDDTDNQLQEAIKLIINK